MRYTRLVENLNKRATKNTSFRRYNLSEIISESYKMIYNAKAGSNLQKLAEAHLEDVRNNPSDVDRLSRQLCNLKYLSSMVESRKMKDTELLVPEEKYSKVVPDKKKDEELEESVHDEDVEETEDEDILEDSNLTDEEVEELTKHLSEIRKKKVAECDATKKVKESKGRRLQRSTECSTPKKLTKSYESLNLSEFNKKSAGKAFVKTFKKLDKQLHEGTALTRQDSISLYKAANSAMTHLSVELEHNPDFLPTFKESVQLLSVDVNKVLGSLMEGKGPSKNTMKSLAKFSEALLREDEEEEDLPDIEDEEEEIIDSEEVDEFDQEYADARVELHKELVDEYSETEDPEILDKIQQDAEEVVSLPGITDEQAAEVMNDLPDSDAEMGDEEDISDVEGEELSDPEVDEEPEVPEEDDIEETDDSDITDEELEALKKHLTEMRKAKKFRESTKARKMMRRS